MACSKLESWLLAVVLTMASGCISDASTATPDGTVVVDWKRSSKLSISDVALTQDEGPSTITEHVLRFATKQGGLLDPRFEDARFDLRIAHGRTQTTSSSGFPAVVQTPRSFTLTATEAGHWTMSQTCEDAIAVPLPWIGADGDDIHRADALLWQICSIHLRRAGIDTLLMLEVYGDGSTKASIGFGTITVE